MTSTQKIKRHIASTVSVVGERSALLSIDEPTEATGAACIGSMFICFVLVALALILFLDGYTLWRHLNLARRNLGLKRKSKKPKCDMGCAPNVYSVS